MGDESGIENTRRFLLEWLSFFHRYIPKGILEYGYEKMKMNWRPPSYYGRDDLETLLGSSNYLDWIKISEMILGKCGKSFVFTPKHKSSAYDNTKGNNGGGGQG